MGLAVALAVSLGGYTVAESTTQRANVAGLQLQAQAEAEAHRQAVAAERQRAVATAQDAIADAAAVQTVVAPTVTEADLAPLEKAVDELNDLLVEVPDVPAAADDAPAADPASAQAAAGEAAAAPASTVDREVRASRAAGRGAVPSETAAAEATAEDAPEDATQDRAAPAEPAQADEAERVQDDAEPAGGSGEAPADGGVDDATEAPAPADDAAPDDSLAARILAAVAKVTEVAAEVQATADANLAAQQAAAKAKAEADAQAAAAAAAAAQAAAAEKAAQRASLDAYANGQIPAEALCELPGGAGHQLRCDAAESFGALNAAYQAQFGTPLAISDSYRSYSAQVACVRVKGYLCARPGTSNHGRGVAVDLAGGVQSFGTAQHRWMAENAGSFGWDLPDWASAGGSKPEPWHWEYVG